MNYETLTLDTRLIPVNGITTLLYRTRDEAVQFGKFALACKPRIRASVRAKDGGFELTLVNR